MNACSSDSKTNVSNKKKVTSQIQFFFEFSPFISYQTTRFPKRNPFRVSDLLNMKAIQVLQKTVHEKNMTDVQ